jgi:hypothetical protein
MGGISGGRIRLPHSRGESNGPLDMGAPFAGATERELEPPERGEFPAGPARLS